MRVSVRNLCEFAAKRGDLDLRFTPSPTALQGMEGHDKVRARRAATYESEITLQGQYLDLEVNGRADGFDPQLRQLEEIKTYRGNFAGIREHHRSLHWAQAKVYAHLMCLQHGWQQLQLALVYFHIDTEKETVLTQTCTAPELRAFFESLCQQYLQWAQQEAAHRSARNHALQGLQFPLGQFRAGQRSLAVAVYRSTLPAQPGNCLLAQAPTGVGKTMGTIFPMLKALPAQGMDQLFFLTAKGTGQALAQQALARTNQQLQSQGQRPLRTITLLARDKSCEHPDKACHGDSCPLAQGFYDRLPVARAALARHPQGWGSSAQLRDTALAHGICPYYLTQEMARWSDVVIADYNYWYDSAALLYATTVAQGWKVGVLVDEAHNLVDRARAMYTATLAQSLLQTARKAATGPVKTALNGLQQAWKALNATSASGYQPLAAIPADWSQALAKVLRKIGQVQAETPLLPGDPVLDFYLQALHFQALEQDMGAHAVADAMVQPPYRRQAAMSTLCIRNVVPARYLAARHAAAHASVLFSGTLTPAHFYRDLLGLPACTVQLEVPELFQPQQLRVTVVDHISTRYQDRAASVDGIAQLMAAQFARQPGNYLCFVSSFAYLQQVAQALQRLAPHIATVQQSPSMDDAARHDFVAQFTEHSCHIGFAVLGGAFGEGVDLPGQRLIGAFIATLGLPQFNPVNERMKAAMQQLFGMQRGYAYTYLFPGMRKVVQAAGRVIRTEADQGVLFLVDERYAHAPIQALLPSWWHIETGGKLP